ncbi:MAG TPA: hypothetical protein VFU63_00215, partial [Ktedonobacterales bacterium]|nr:hypothetical protein [Ktedonobacterales bacterium]
MKSLARRLRTLRWRLMLSCFVAAFTAMMSLMVAFVVLPGVIAMNSPQRPVALVQGLQRLAPRIAPYLRQTSPDRARILAAVTTYREAIPVTEELTDSIHTGGDVVAGKNATLLVTGRNGEALAALMPATSSASDLSHLEHLSETKAVLAAALRKDTHTANLIQNTPGDPTVAAVPIVDSDGTVLGALLISVDLTALLRSLYAANLLALVPAVLLFAIIASIFGAIFGMRTARGLTQRLLRLTSAADAWSKGDFTASARDPSQDELG